MNILIKVISLILIAMLMAISHTFAQERVKIESEKDISFDNESESTEVKIDVEKKYGYLQFHILSQLEEGEIIILLLDPKGVEKGNLTIKSNHTKITKGNKTDVQERVSGELEKIYRSPLSGYWIVKVIPKSATGKVRIRSVMIFNNKSELMELDQIESESNN